MKKISRIGILITSVLLIIAYFVPLWKINLQAPQYPEGLELKIWLNSIKGSLQTINNLNHYIGMKVIEPGSIAELKFMPVILGVFIVFGIFVAVINKKFLLYTWFVSYATLGIIGLVDFYNWEYDYGHNLNPHAAIKIEGMSYQPPLIGTKKLLNFTAGSYPDIGGIILILVGIIVFVFVVMELGNIYKKKVISDNKNISLISLFLILITAFSCNATPVEIEYGKDSCDNCKMTIMDKRFGTEIITSKGKIFRFDSVECMLDYYVHSGNNEKYKQFFVTDFSTPPKFTEALNAFYLHSEKIQSPMGENLSAFKSKEELEKIRKDNPGEVLSWNDLVKLFSKKNEKP